MENYLEVNRESWNNRLESHLSSDFYNLEGFKKGDSSLNPIELSLLGDVKGKRILHLQCHFGQDTISLSRLGADVTGVDLSDKSIAKGQELAKELNTTTQFVCSDVYNLPNHLKGEFDIVFTSYGTISWLPDLSKWAGVIDHFLSPGGRFIFVEFHPAIWMFDDDMNHIEYSYFNDEPIAEEETGTYADREANIVQKYVCWNHSLAEVVMSLRNRGLAISSLQEFNHSPYNFIQKMEEVEPGKFRVKHFGDKMPLVYAIEAIKPQL